MQSHLPGIVGLLNHFDVGACNLPDVNATPYEQVHVEAVLVLHVGPSRHHQQRSRDVTDTAWAHMPKRTLRVDQRIGVAEARALQGYAAQERVVHGLLVEISVLCVVISDVELVLEEDKTATRA